MTFKPEKCPPEIDAAIHRCAKKYNLPRWFIYAIIEGEAGEDYDPKAVNTTDGAAHTPWFGAGLTQLTWLHHKGMPYPMDLKEPDNSYQDWIYDMGINRYGEWVKMTEVSKLTDPFDPDQNLDRFATIHAVPWFLHLRRQNPGLDDMTVLERTAHNYNRGVFNFNYDDKAYTRWYIPRAAKYKPLVEADDGPWDGKPHLPEPIIDKCEGCTELKGILIEWARGLRVSLKEVDSELEKLMDKLI